MEHISLCHNGHKCEYPSNVDVSIWLNKLLDINFKSRDIIIMQINNSTYQLINGEGYISVKFTVDEKMIKYPYNIRVPVEMTAFQQDRHPIIFLLHILEGIVDELEIYTADSSLIDKRISLLNVSYTVDDIVKII